MISGRTVSVDWAISTRVNTLFIPACQVVGTLRIRETFILPASLIWVSFVAWPALASCSVVSDTTFSVQATLFKCARVQTFSIVTGFYDGAFIIRLAASCVEDEKKDKLLFCSHPIKNHNKLTFFTNLMGVSNKSRSTDAYGAMVLDLTLCPNPTGQCKAWVFTFLIYACKMRRAVRVNQAFWLRSWKGKFHASKESLDLMCCNLWLVELKTLLCLIYSEHSLYPFLVGLLSDSSQFIACRIVLFDC